MKIKSIKSLGTQQTFSLEMRGDQHNFITYQSGAVHKNSHAVSYCLWAYRCLWFKAHYPEEWWASVLSHCNQDRIEQYMTAARSEGVKFGAINIGRMTMNPVANAGKNSVDGQNMVSLGLINLKSVGDKIANEFQDTERKTYADIDQFVAEKGKSKTLLERLIKLGAFQSLHPSIKATWMWYQHEYGSGKIDWRGKYWALENGQWIERSQPELQRTSTTGKLKSQITVSQLRQHHQILLLRSDGWTREKIAAERDRQIMEYRRLYPKRSKVPVKIMNWEPDPRATRDRVMGLYDDDYSLREILEFEKEYLGYYWHSPVDLFHTSGKTIRYAKVKGHLEGVIRKKIAGKTSNGNDMLKLIITDGVEECLVILWENDLRSQPRDVLAVNAGVRMQVNYDETRNSFTLQRGSIVQPLWTKKGWQDLQDGELKETIEEYAQ